MEKIIAFLRDVRLELAKVSWPTRSQTIKYTAAVLLMSAFVALFLGGLDTVFEYILNKLLLK